MPRKKAKTGSQTNRGAALRPAQYAPDYRRCLGFCGKEFWSLGPALRVCRKCREKQLAVSERGARGVLRFDG